jgi:hypothetical protein
VRWGFATPAKLVQLSLKWIEYIHQALDVALLQDLSTGGYVPSKNLLLTCFSRRNVRTPIVNTPLLYNPLKTRANMQRPTLEV